MSTDQTHISVVTDEALTVWLKSWSRGQKSQAAYAICSGGVSAIIGSSDLDAHTLGSRGAAGNQQSCSLPFEAERPILERRGKPSLRSAMKGRKLADLSPAVAGHPKRAREKNFKHPPGKMPTSGKTKNESIGLSALIA